MHLAKYGWISLLLAYAACTGAEAGDVALPQREAGMWEITLTDERASRRLRHVTTRQCTSEEVDARLLLSVASGQDHCAAIDVRKTASGWEVYTACDVHGNRLDTRFVLEGDLRSRYSGSFETRHGKHCLASARDCIETRTFSARRLGACPDNLHPGDTLLPNGIVINTLDSNHQHDRD